jgi:hypothetical protein
MVRQEKLDRINEILLRNGFEWFSSGKDSCWITMKTTSH